MTATPEALARTIQLFLVDGRAPKDTGYSMHSFANLKAEPIAKGILTASGTAYEFTQSYMFKSLSAAAVVLDRNSNGRQDWKVVGSKLTYHEGQELKARSAGGET